MNLKQRDLFGSIMNARYFSDEPAGGGGGGGGTSPPETPPTPPTATPPETPPATPPAGDTLNFHTVIGPDGKLMDGWKQGLPEDIRHELCLDTFGTVSELVRSHVNAQKMIGRDKVVIPTDKAAPQEVRAFYERLGCPKTPDEYKVSIKPELKEYYDDGLVGDFRKVAHEIGLNQKQLDRLMSYRELEIQKGVEFIQADEQRAYQEAEQAILMEAGESLESMKELANKCIADNCPDEARKEKLLEAINSNELRPLMFSFLANIQKKYFAEHGGMPGGDTGGMAPQSMESKAKELMATPGYMDGTMKNSNPEGYNRLTREITDLYTRAEKAQKAAQNVR